MFSSRLIKSIVAIASFAFTHAAVGADAGLITKRSHYSVMETVERF
jgi:hypothetical protein